MTSLQLATRVVMAVGAAVGAVSGWFTWTLSGSATRDSFASLRAAQILGIDQLTPFRVVWFLVPVACAATIIVVLVFGPRWAAIVAVPAGLVLLAFGGGMLTTSVASGVGPWLACGAGVAVVSTSVAGFAQGRVRS